jgi:hypothetical protein
MYQQVSVPKPSWQPYNTSAGVDSQSVHKFPIHKPTQVAPSEEETSSNSETPLEDVSVLLDQVMPSLEEDNPVTNNSQNDYSLGQPPTVQKAEIESDLDERDNLDEKEDKNLEINPKLDIAAKLSVDSSNTSEIAQVESLKATSGTTGEGGQVSTAPIVQPTPQVKVQRLCTECEQEEGEEKNEDEKLSRMGLQAKLTIGEPGDKYEQEADQVARQVVQRINAPQRDVPDGEPIQKQPDLMAKVIQRIDESRQEEKAIPQVNNDFVLRAYREAVGDSAPDVQANFETTLNRARGGGSALDKAFRAKVESAMGADFSGVKVHTDAEADQLNRSIQARAFTTGEDIFFSQGTYEPSSQQGQELIAHELTHVVQQTGKVRSKLNSQQSVSQSQRSQHKTKSNPEATDTIQSKCGACTTEEKKEIEAKFLQTKSLSNQKSSNSSQGNGELFDTIQREQASLPPSPEGAEDPPPESSTPPETYVTHNFLGYQLSRGATLAMFTESLQRRCRRGATGRRLRSLITAAEARGHTLIRQYGIPETEGDTGRLTLVYEVIPHSEAIISEESLSVNGVVVPVRGATRAELESIRSILARVPGPHLEAFVRLRNRLVIVDWTGARHPSTPAHRLTGGANMPASQPRERREVREEGNRIEITHTAMQEADRGLDTILHEIGHAVHAARLIPQRVSAEEGEYGSSIHTGPGEQVAYAYMRYLLNQHLRPADRRAFDEAFRRQGIPIRSGSETAEEPPVQPQPKLISSQSTAQKDIEDQFLQTKDASNQISSTYGGQSSRYLSQTIQREEASPSGGSAASGSTLVSGPPIVECRRDNAQACLVHLHGSESEALEVARRLYCQYCVNLVYIDNPGRRHITITYTLNSREYNCRVDPNRIFSRAAIEAQIPLARPPESPRRRAAIDAVEQYGQELLRKINRCRTVARSGGRQQDNPVVALHGNTGLNIRYYLEGVGDRQAQCPRRGTGCATYDPASDGPLTFNGRPLQFNARRVEAPFNPRSSSPIFNPHIQGPPYGDFILVTDPNDFYALVQQGRNVVLQSPNAPRDGSLSVVDPPIGRYVNIEVRRARRGYLERDGRRETSEERTSRVSREEQRAIRVETEMGRGTLEHLGVDEASESCPPSGTSTSCPSCESSPSSPPGAEEQAATSTPPESPAPAGGEGATSTVQASPAPSPAGKIQRSPLSIPITGTPIRDDLVQRHRGNHSDLTLEQKYEHILEEHAGTSRAVWDSGYIDSPTFLGMPIHARQTRTGTRTGTGRIHQELYDCLRIAEGTLRTANPGRSDDEIRRQIGLRYIIARRAIGSASGRERMSFHSFGLAIDVNKSENIFIAHSTNPRGTGEREIFRRITHLMGGTEIDFHRFTLPVAELHARLVEVSDQVREYIALREIAHEPELRRLMERRDGAVPNDQAIRNERGQIRRDYRRLDRGNPTWDPATEPFFDLSLDLVQALCNAGLTWHPQLAGGRGADTQHFDYRGGTIQPGHRV